LNGNADLALGEAFEAVKIAEQNNLTGLLANGYATLGTIYQNQLTYDKAISFVGQAEKVNLKLKNALIASKIYNTLGLISIDKRNYDSAMVYFKKALALEYYYKALEAAKKSVNNRAQALALFNIGNTILAEKKYAEAEKLLLQSLALSTVTGEAKIRGASYMALGQLKNETGKFDEAHVYLSSFYRLKKQFGVTPSDYFQSMRQMN